MVFDDTAGSKVQRERAMADWALERWARFPVDQEPRALVFTGPMVVVDRGFTTGNAQLAFLRREVEVEGDVPDDVLVLLGGPGSPDRHAGTAVPAADRGGSQG